MTDLEKLDALISAVIAGETSRVHIERMSGDALLPEAGSIYGSAYQDDLNAARMVHAALVPFWAVERLSSWPGSKCAVYLRGTHEGEDGERWHGGSDGESAGHDDLLGRAWLLAALMAYRKGMVE